MRFFWLKPWFGLLTIIPLVKTNGHEYAGVIITLMGFKQLLRKERFDPGNANLVLRKAINLWIVQELYSLC